MHPDIFDRFGEDIEELLALKQESGNDPLQQSWGLVALINGILRFPSGGTAKEYDIYQTVNDPKFNFKRYLLHILQELISYQTQNIMKRRKEDLLLINMLANDFERAVTWTKVVDREPLHMHKPIGRKIMISRRF